MGEVAAIGQKLKGKLEKAKGTIQQRTSAPSDLHMQLKGGINKLKGTVHETVADVRLSRKRNARRLRARGIVL